MAKLIRTVLIGLAFVTGGTSAAYACKLVAGYGEEAPYHYTGPEGKIIGIDADFLRLVANEAGCQLEFQELPWKRTLHLVRKGGVDLTMGASFKPERAEFAHYSVPYRGQPHVVFEKKSNPSGTTDLRTFLQTKRRLGIVLGWHYTNEIQKLLKNSSVKDQIMTAPNFDSIMAMSKFNRFDGFLANPSQVAGAIGKDRLAAEYNMIKADVDVLHFIFSKHRVKQEFVDDFNKRAADHIRRGTFMKICRKYEEKLIASCSFLSTIKSPSG